MSLGMKAVAAAQENGSLRQRLETGGAVGKAVRAVGGGL